MSINQQQNGLLHSVGGYCAPPDSELSLESRNAPQNRAVAEEFQKIKRALCMEKNELKEIVFLSSDRYEIEDSSESHVFVRNGLAIVQINYVIVKDAVPLGETIVLCSGLPAPMFTNEWHAFSPSYTREGEQMHMLVDGSGNLIAYGGANGIGYRISFPYFIKSVDNRRVLK